MNIAIPLGIALFMGFLMGYLSASIRLRGEIDHYRIGADVQEREFQVLFQKYINLHAKITADPNYRPPFYDVTTHTMQPPPDSEQLSKPTSAADPQ